MIGNLCDGRGECATHAAVLERKQAAKNPKKKSGLERYFMVALAVASRVGEVGTFAYRLRTILLKPELSGAFKITVVHLNLYFGESVSMATPIRHLRSNSQSRVWKIPDSIIPS